MAAASQTDPPRWQLHQITPIAQEGEERATTPLHTARCCGRGAVRRSAPVLVTRGGPLRGHWVTRFPASRTGWERTRTATARATLFMNHELGLRRAAPSPCVGGNQEPRRDRLRVDPRRATETRLPGRRAYDAVFRRATRSWARPPLVGNAAQTPRQLVRAVLLGLAGRPGARLRPPQSTSTNEEEAGSVELVRRHGRSQSVAVFENDGVGEAPRRCRSSGRFAWENSAVLSPERVATLHRDLMRTEDGPSNRTRLTTTASCTCTSARRTAGAGAACAPDCNGLNNGTLYVLRSRRTRAGTASGRASAPARSQGELVALPGRRRA